MRQLSSATYDRYIQLQKGKLSLKRSLKRAYNGNPNPNLNPNPNPKPNPNPNPNNGTLARLLGLSSP